MSVTLRLADEIDVSRGDMIVHPANPPRAEHAVRRHGRSAPASGRSIGVRKSYLLKHTTQTVRAEVESIGFQIDLESLEHTKAEALRLNDIGQVTLRTHRPVFVDALAGTNRATGAFILIDSLTNDTVAAGMILEPSAARARPLARADFDHTQVSPSERRERLGHLRRPPSSCSSEKGDAEGQARA